MTFETEERYSGNEIKKLTDRRRTRYIERYERVGANVFEWDGLPEGITSNDIEQKLIRGNTVLFNSEEQGFILARASVTGWDVMDRPKIIKTHFYNNMGPFKIYGEPELKHGTDCVLIQDLKNYRKKRMDYITQGMICDRMADIDIAIQQQIVNQRAPLIFTSEGSTGTASGKVFAQAYMDGMAVYYGSGGIGSKLVALSVESPWNALDLEIMRGTYWNEGLEMLGVDNTPAMQKRERMNNIEVESNEELLNVYLEDALGSRLQACEDIKKVFGLDVTVKVAGRDVKGDYEGEEEIEEEIEDEI